jgi:hypothetical protein
VTDADADVDSLSALRRSPLRTLVPIAWTLIGVLLCVGAYRVWLLETREFDHGTTPRTLRALMRETTATRLSARIDSVVLQANDHALFELCAQDGMPNAHWQGALELLVIQVSPQKLLLRVPLDAAHLKHVRRNRQGGCLLLGSGTLEFAGTYHVEAVWPTRPPPATVLDVPLRSRVSAKTALGQADRVCVAALAGSVLLLLIGLLVTQRSHSPATASTRTSSTSALGAGLAVLLLFGTSQLPLFGATYTVLKGALLFSVQAGLAFALGRYLNAHDAIHSLGTAAKLGLLRPQRAVLAITAGVIAWPLLVWSARLAMRFVPSTGEAPIEAFIAWPSGMLAAALLGVLLPLGEELFFRGYLYAVLLPTGRAFAASMSLLVFTLLHVQQSWGNWGGLLAIVAAGSVLTGLRVLTGSTLVSALTHVAYNLTLSLGSIYAASTDA